MINYNVDSDGIATITWDMPGRTMNVLNEGSIAAYAEALQKALKDEKVKGIILTSGKDSFIAGADLEMLLNADTSDAAKLTDQFSQLQKLFRSQETGGKPLLNTNRALALATAREDTRSFYWLGFSPGWKRDDKLHAIRLETTRSDLKVRTRSGFLDLSRKAEVSMMVESALLFGNPPGALQMPLKVDAVNRGKRGELEIALTLGLPVGVSVTSGFNAVAHSVEALYAPDGSPVTSLIATEGVRAIVGALPVPSIVQ